MKKHILASLIAFGTFFITSCTAQKVGQSSVVEKSTEEMILGEFKQQDLTKNNYATWYLPEYTEYEVESVKLKGLEDKVSEYDIVTFIGTWCGDSKRELPRLYKILESVNYPIVSKMKVYGVNREKKTTKGLEKGKSITHVPTIIFYKDGKEVGRIVESPVTGYLEEDIAMIVSGTPLTPNYAEN